LFSVVVVISSSCVRQPVPSTVLPLSLKTSPVPNRPLLLHLVLVPLLIPILPLPAEPA
jgi:hypothetical protein